MHVTLQAPSWGPAQPTPELLEAIAVLGDGVWKESAVRYHADRIAKERYGRRAPKGMQGELNRVITERMEAADWTAMEGRFAKGRTWVRVTFRHQMSLGSDLVDAMKMCKREGFELAVILAADAKTLRTISPNDAGAMVSFEKLRIGVADLEGVTDIPLLVGCLTPESAPPQEVAAALERERPRDVTRPQ